eukprot:TRINITY_DN29331_c0_g1_i1.p1 TRINITY_DN29331_c0_g1~~TRINITY_DN29331_c0_g1_i1.p1  ORF type:complete len:191 (-),score=41.62 TRINITY_DN29331_c0_g1_i1:27-599(-)
MFRFCCNVLSAQQTRFALTISGLVQLILAILMIPLSFDFGLPPAIFTVVAFVLCLGIFWKRTGGYSIFYGIVEVVQLILNSVIGWILLGAINVMVIQCDGCDAISKDCGCNRAVLDQLFVLRTLYFIQYAFILVSLILVMYLITQLDIEQNAARTDFGKLSKQQRQQLNPGQNQYQNPLHQNHQNQVFRS